MTPWRWVLALATLAAVACSSPEATRQRGGGPGADVGNRGPAVEMHGGSDPYHDTPRLLQGGRPVPAPPSPARRVSRQP